MIGGLAAGMVSGGTAWATKVKAKSIRRTTNLFGNESINEPFQSRLVAVFRVDPDGEEIQLISKRDQNSAEFDIGRLRPGEVFAVRLENLSVISAICEYDTIVECALIQEN